MDLIASLQSFLRVAQTGSFSAVAHERGVTQPAISRQVSALEEHLGTRLVQRSTQAVTLTDEGREFLGAAQRLVDEAEALRHAVGTRRGKAVGTVRVAVPVPLGVYLGARLGPLMDRHDELSVDLVLRDGASNLIEDGLDLEIRLGPLGDCSMVARQIGWALAHVVASPDYLDRRGEPRHPGELEGHDCIVYHRRFNEKVWWFDDPGTAGGELAMPVCGRIHTNNAVAAHQAALAGQGIAHISHLLVDEDLRAGRLKLLLPAYPTRRFPLYAVYPSKRSLPPRIRVVIDHLCDLLAQDPAMSLADPARVTAPNPGPTGSPTAIGVAMSSGVADPRRSVEAAVDA
ncbi:MAG: LysR family transcriptional regulator [Mitsuaria chitosanitabida]|uniref:LysR family transcriptional regulator n=1 Tax=Roseateles chitosanitabidus TaxID=65048 RepID=UPI001B2BF48D|nr:LysR family transcriptional regulator [Roseateles chitosanitabidus]MBO9685227.1 LysR family transcriptional regulator [Roseateles chitosanitabidus]